MRILLVRPALAPPNLLLLPHLVTHREATPWEDSGEVGEFGVAAGSCKSTRSNMLWGLAMIEKAPMEPEFQNKFSCRKDTVSLLKLSLKDQE